MKRSSTKKSSTFKIQAEKNVFRNYLEHISDAQTVQDYPHLHDTILRTSEVVFDYCYSYSEESPFLRGLNYNSRNYGFFQFQNILTYREWMPDTKEVYLFGDFNNWNQSSHPLEPLSDEPEMFRLEIDTNESRINEGTQLMLRTIDNKDDEHFMIPPSCYTMNQEYGIFHINNRVPVSTSKKLHSIEAYTFDFNILPLEQTQQFIEDNQELLEHFNVIIFRNLFENNSPLIDRCRLPLKKMIIFRDLVSKIKNQLGLKVILEWSFKGGKKRYADENPFEDQVVKCVSQNTFQYDLSKKNVMAIYLANLSYYMIYYAVDGFHFKHIDEFCSDQDGQILIKCINLLNLRLSEHGLTLASSKKDIPGLNRPILEGGLGFTFTYSYNTHLLISQNHKELKQNFEKILKSSNCISINFENLNEENFLNLIFAFFVSEKGIFCKGDFQKIKQPLKRLLFIRKKSDLFTDKAEIESITEEQMTIRRGPALIMFNFGENQIKKKIDDQMDLMYSSDEDLKKQQNNEIVMAKKSCCIYEYDHH